MWYLIVAVIPSAICLFALLWDAIEILQLSREVFRNLVGTANSRAAEVNSLNPSKSLGCLKKFNNLNKNKQINKQNKQINK